jgi:YCII-related domain
MSSFILLYNGPPIPPGASHEGWPEWFRRAGDNLADMGSPMTNGFVVHSDGTTTETPTSLNGYSIIRAEDRDEAVELVKDHPFLTLGDEFTIEAFEVPNK